MLVDAVVVQGSKDETDHFPRDVEVYVSTAATAGGPFTKVATTALAPEGQRRHRHRSARSRLAS